MPDIIVTGTSGYATGGIDSASVLISNVSTISARHPNGCASGVVQIETILGNGPTLKGTQADLATRLAVALNPTGTHALTGFTGLTTDRGLLALSPTEMQVMNHTPIGVIQAFGGVSAPANWLLCDGQAVSRTTYVKLFGVIATLYGVGNGSTTFNVPDLRGRVPMGIDGTANRTTVSGADTLGGTGGSDTFTTAQMPPMAARHAAAAGGGSTAFTGPFTTANGFSDIGGLVNPPGVNAPHHDPFQVVNYIIFAGV